MWAIDGTALGEVYIGAAMVWVVSLILVTIDALCESVWMTIFGRSPKRPKAKKNSGDSGAKYQVSLATRLQRRLLGADASRGSMSGGAGYIHIAWVLSFLAAAVPVAYLLYVGSVMLAHGY
ncbi:MAG: hypothetical protein VCD00_18155 [Candidatus Hydrogenedentota bacterium]